MSKNHTARKFRELSSLQKENPPLATGSRAGCGPVVPALGTASPGGLEVLPEPQDPALVSWIIKNVSLCRNDFETLREPRGGLLIGTPAAQTGPHWAVTALPGCPVGLLVSRRPGFQGGCLPSAPSHLIFLCNPPKPGCRHLLPLWASAFCQIVQASTSPGTC